MSDADLQPEGTADAAVDVSPPNFQYTLPSIPVAEYTETLGEGSVTVKLTLTGSVTVSFDKSQNATVDANDGSWQLAASKTLDGLNSGLQISGILTEHPSIESTWGSQFVQTGYQFTPPNEHHVLGQVQINYPADTDKGTAHVQGTAGYDLEITVTPNETPDEVVSDVAGFVRTFAWVAAVGTIVLRVAIVLSAAPETAGGSLLLLPAAI